MQRQGALADSPLAGAHGDEMTHPGEPVGDAGPLFGNLLEDSGASVAGDVVVALHFQPGGFAPPDPPTSSLPGAPWAPLRSVGRAYGPLSWPRFACNRGASPRRTPLRRRSRGPDGPRSA